MRLLIPVLVGIDIVSAALLSLRGPFPAFVPLGTPTAYRSIYTHVPVSIAVYVLAAVSAFYAFRAMRTREEKYIRRLDAVVYLLIFASAFSFVSGTIWSSESWGSPWTWDPRQVTVLILFITYAAYPALRRSIGDPDKNLAASAMYVLASLSVVVISFAAPVIAESLHPRPGEAVSALTPQIRSLFGARLLVVVALLFLLMSRGAPRHVAAAYIASAIPIAVLGALDSSTPTQRVVNVTAVGDSYLVRLENGTVLGLSIEEARRVIDPPLIDGRPTLVQHMVSVSGDLRIVNHPSVYVNLALYYVFMGLMALTSWRVSRRS